MPSTGKTQVSKLAVAALVLLSSSACTRLQIGPSTPDALESDGSTGTVSNQPAPVVGTAAANGSVYVVQSGDSLYSVGRRFNLNYQQLAALNQISPPYLLRPGQRLVLSANAALPPSATPVSAPVVTPVAPVVNTSAPQVLTFDWNTGTAQSAGRAQPLPAAVYNAPVSAAPPMNAPTVPVVPVASIAPQPAMQAYANTQTGTPRTVAPSVTSGAMTEEALYYSVKTGDTLDTIAKHYQVDYQSLAAWNNLQPPYALRVGQSLLVSAGKLSSAAPDSGMPAVGNVSYHRVQPGDTLYSIARQYGRTYQEIAAWNQIPAPYHLQVGQNLRVSAANAPQRLSMASANAPLASGTFSGNGGYQVAPGDTLSSIGRRFNCSVADLAAWNGLQKPYALQAGQSLLVAPQSFANPVASAPMQSLNASGNPPAALTAETLMAANRAAEANAAQPVSNTTQVRKTLRGEVVYHAVQAGESLASIASQYGQNTHELALWNGIAPPYPIYPGQTIMIYR